MLDQKLILLLAALAEQKRHPQLSGCLF